MNLDLNLVLDLDLDLDLVIQSMWPPYKAIKCGARPMKKSSLNAWNVSKAAKKEGLGTLPATRAITSFMAAQKVNSENLTFL